MIIKIIKSLSELLISQHCSGHDDLVSYLLGSYFLRCLYLPKELEAMFDCHSLVSSCHTCS